MMAEFDPLFCDKPLDGHETVDPVVAVTAARPFRTEPLTLSKLPPSSTLEPSGETASARTPQSATFGAQGVSTPDASTAAARGRTAPFTWVNSPPKYTVVPCTVIP